MKVLLTAINAKYIHSNLAVYSLRAYAGKYAQQTEIAEYTINQTMDDILSDIYRKKPDILCLSCYLWNILYVEQLITEISQSAARDADLAWRAGSVLQCSFCDGASIHR